jgi:signal peptidase I
MPEPEESKKKKRTKSVVRDYFELIVETAVFVFFVMTFVVQAFQIPTGSMEPTLLVGDFLLVNKLIYASTLSPLEEKILPRRSIRRGDIIVFKYPNELSKDYVKRAIGFPGEKVQIWDKKVYINDAPLDEKYKVHSDGQILASTADVRDNYGPVIVPEGSIFAMGDNRDNSQDSRYWGFLPQSYIKGRPWVIYFSYRAESDAYQKTGIGDRLKKLVTFLPKARWNRMLRLVR